MWARMSSDIELEGSKKIVKNYFDLVSKKVFLDSREKKEFLWLAERNTTE